MTANESQFSGKVTEALGKLTGDNAEELEGKAQQFKQTAGEVVDSVKQQASTRLSNQIGAAAETIGKASEALQGVGKQLREQDQAPIAQYADQAAQQVQRASEYLRGKDLDQLIAEAERVGRQQPALFVGGAFALGLLAARFLKSSPPEAPAAMGSARQGAQNGSSFNSSPTHSPTYSPTPTYASPTPRPSPSAAPFSGSSQRPYGPTSSTEANMGPRSTP